MKFLKPFVLLWCFFVFQNQALADAQWMNVGVPTQVWLGTNGDFFMKGSENDTCNVVSPSYYRVDTNAQHWKDFWGFILYMAAQNKPLRCTVDKGCGTSEVWVSYCTGPLR
jgi:hypothetical protein